jgi:hypothetical protein
MRLVRNLFIFSFLFFVSNLKSVIFVVHGAASERNTWQQEVGRALAAHSGDVVVVFRWHQPLMGVFEREIIGGGKDLAAQIVRYKRSTLQEYIDYSKSDAALLPCERPQVEVFGTHNTDSGKIILIGHSHGGHVVRVASCCLGSMRGMFEQETEDLSVQTVKITLLHLLENTLNDGAHPGRSNRLDRFVRSLSNARSFEDLKQAVGDLPEVFRSNQEFRARFSWFLNYNSERELANILNNRIQSSRVFDVSGDQILIDAIYTLGTPNRLFNIQADPTIVKNLYNGFSESGDWCEDFVGHPFISEEEEGYFDGRALNVVFTELEAHRGTYCICWCNSNNLPPFHEDARHPHIVKCVWDMINMFETQSWASIDEYGSLVFTRNHIGAKFAYDNSGIGAEAEVVLHDVQAPGQRRFMEFLRSLYCSCCRTNGCRLFSCCLGDRALDEEDGIVPEAIEYD